MVRHNRSRISPANIVSTLFPFAIWLSSFNSLVPGVTIGDILLCVCLILCVSYSLYIDESRQETKWIIGCIAFQLTLGCIGLAVRDSILWDSVIRRTVKFVYYIFAVVSLRNKLDIRITVRTFEIILYCASVGIIIQYGMYYMLGKTLNVIKVPLLQYPDVYSTIAFNYFFRPSAFFLEPSHLTQYTIPIIIIELFRNDEDKGIIKGIVYSILCVLTTSGTAIFMISFLWGGYFLIRSRESVKGFIRTLIIMVFIVLIAYFGYSHVPQIQFAIERLSDTNSVVYSGRLSNGEFLIKGMNSIEKIIGVGFGNVDMSVYMNSITYLYYSGGLLTIIAWLILTIRLFLKEKVCGKLIILSFAALCSSSRIFLSMSICYYLLFCITGIEKKIFYNEPPSENYS